MISIHAPLTGCDGINKRKINYTVEFQSTHPLRDATTYQWYLMSAFIISIHAPLTGCDLKCRGASGLLDISIHAPLTGCDIMIIILILKSTHFNPRTPYGMRHKPMTYAYGNANISIHAPLTGCDIRMMATSIIVGKFQSTHPLRDATCSRKNRWYHCLYFNPRTPYGMRLNIKVRLNQHAEFQSTHPLRDAT